MYLSNAPFVAGCFGTLHQDFDRLVSKDDPAISGEIVHTFLTGLRGASPVPYSVPNPTNHLVPVTDPPALGDPTAANILFFGLAPGLIGIEQLDLQIVHPFQGGRLFNYTSICTAPPVSGQ
jgi:uncharacterized protein (TIGR03437 family)